jgi:hypothetical protein
MVYFVCSMVCLMPASDDMLAGGAETTIKISRINQSARTVP